MPTKANKKKNNKKNKKKKEEEEEEEEEENDGRPREVAAVVSFAFRTARGGSIAGQVGALTMNCP